jgi:hypothetical protein
MRHLGEEIAVLDGLDGFDGLGAADGRIGRTPASGAEYASRPVHNFETRRNVLDASGGANYSGGSSYAPRLPLLPSTVGLAGVGGMADADLVSYSKITNVLPPRKNVIDPSGGANYSGGSSYAPGVPLVTSGDPGLAAMMNPESYDDFAQLDPSVPTIQGGYGRGGLGQVRWPGGAASGGGYGRAGLGRTDMYSDFDGLALGDVDRTVGSSLEIEDGRIGRRPASGAEYTNRAAHNFETRRNVIDASEGANYSGGSSYAAGLPLMPSSVGLAGLDAMRVNPRMLQALRAYQALKRARTARARQILLRQIKASGYTFAQVKAAHKKLVMMKRAAQGRPAPRRAMPTRVTAMHMARSISQTPRQAAIAAARRAF